MKALFLRESFIGSRYSVARVFLYRRFKVKVLFLRESFIGFQYSVAVCSFREDRSESYFFARIIQRIYILGNPRSTFGLGLKSCTKVRFE